MMSRQARDEWGYKYVMGLLLFTFYFLNPNMSYQIPQLVCVKTSCLSPSQFREWIQDSNNIYIGQNYSRYTGLMPHTTPWTIPRMEEKKLNKTVSIEGYLQQYRLYLKTLKMDDIMNLNGKQIGCLCEDFKSCHGSVIQALFKEEVLEKKKSL